jgi:diaminopropionate ammonia-lyase
MFMKNASPLHNQTLVELDAQALSVEQSNEVERFLTFRAAHKPTPLKTLPSLAREHAVAAVFVKDESERLGLGSFKALGGSYAVVRLLLEEAGRRLGRTVDVSEIDSAPVRQIAVGLTVGCATDGNHGRSVAAGAQMVGAKAVIFVHAGVTDERVAAIARFGADIVRVPGTYDDSVSVADQVCRDKGWIVVSDTSWPGYERVPGLVMQGYTALLNEIVRELDRPPTHVFIQAGVGGLAAAVAGYFDLMFGRDRPAFIVVEPDRAACIYASALNGRLTKIDHGEPTIMAMLECYEPSLVAWRILSRKADAFMTVSEDDAAAAMCRLARPTDRDPAIVAGESGAAGLAGFSKAARDRLSRESLGLDHNSRVLLVNTEGATDRARYGAIVGFTPEAVLGTD